MRDNCDNAGFTLIEILIVVLISALLAGMTIMYSGASRDTISLSVKATEVAQALLRAKSFAVSTYSATGSAHACGYGVSFDSSANTFSIVSYEPSGGTTCPSAGAVASAGMNGDDLVSYSQSSWQVSVGPGVSLAASSPSLVLFYPPDPATLMSNDACSPGEGCTYTFPATPTFMTVTLVASDGSASEKVTIGPGGQVDVQ